MTFEAVACPECFTNHGFRETLKFFCQNFAGVCPHCGISGSLKADKKCLKDAMIEFFVLGSIKAEDRTYVYQINESNSWPADFDPTLASDADLASNISETIVFNYGPPLWHLGMTDQYYDFEAGGAERRMAAESIVKAASRCTLPIGTGFFRVRLNPQLDEKIATAQAFDPPPSNITRTPGRWDDIDHPVLYVSDDVELCLHECRTTISDEIVVANLVTSQVMHLLDLTQDVIIDDVGPFGNVNVFINVMCKSRGRWLDYCREISRVALASGYDGIRYASYYAQSKQNCGALNVAVFGRPIVEGKLKLQSLNRLRITDMRYNFQFGPVLYDR